MGDSLLIHAFAYSLFIGLCSVAFNMTGYSHSYHSIKLIHYHAPQRDVSSDKMVLCGDSYFLFHTLPVFFIEYCHKLCIQKQMVVQWKHVSYLLNGKYLKKSSFIPSPHYSLFPIRMVLYHFNRYLLGLVSTYLCTYHRTEEFIIALANYLVI